MAETGPMAETGMEHWRRAVMYTFAGIFAASLLGGLVGGLTGGGASGRTGPRAGRGGAHRHGHAVAGGWDRQRGVRRRALC